MPNKDRIHKPPNDSEGGAPISTLGTAQPYTLGGFIEILAVLGIDWRFNERLREVELLDPMVGGGWVNENIDRHEQRIRGTIRDAAKNTEGKQWHPSKEIWTEMLAQYTSTPERSVDDFQSDFLDVLPVWDRTNRVEGFLESIWPNTRGNELAVWCSRYLFLAPIVRALKPGATIRQIPVLVGPQACGKSSLVRWLAIKDGWHTDAVNLTATDKENDERTSGRVYAEIAEMVGSRRADIDRMKAYLTSVVDGQTRGAYKRYPDRYPRRWVAVGTGNDSGVGTLPNDASGNTRFVVVEVCDPVRQPHTMPSSERDQLYAEALYKHSVGSFGDEWMSPMLPQRLSKLQATVNKEHTATNPVLEDAIETLSKHKKFTVIELVEELYRRWPDGAARPYEKQVFSAMKKAGWLSRRASVDGKQRRVWVYPDAANASTVTQPALGGDV